MRGIQFQFESTKIFEVRQFDFYVEFKGFALQLEKSWVIIISYALHSTHVKFVV